MDPIVANKIGVKFRNYGMKRPTLKQRMSSIANGKQRYIWALKDISFHIRTGEVFFVIGRNGAGKTTLLRVLAQTLFPNTGSLEIYGGINAFLSMGLGFRPILTGIDNILLSLSFMGLSRKQSKELLPSIIEFSQLGRYINAPIKYYSAGMKARLAFAVATAIEPDILVMDEVINAGDEEFREKSHQKIDQILESARAVIIATHNLENVIKMGSRAMWIEKGVMQNVGDPAEVVRDYREFVKALRKDPLYDLRNK